MKQLIIFFIHACRWIFTMAILFTLFFYFTLFATKNNRQSSHHEFYVCTTWLRGRCYQSCWTITQCLSCDSTLQGLETQLFGWHSKTCQFCLICLDQVIMSLDNLYKWLTVEIIIDHFTLHTLANSYCKSLIAVFLESKTSWNRVIQDTECTWLHIPWHYCSLLLLLCLLHVHVYTLLNAYL